jgi:galactose mutarotase-like enzyme
VGFCRNQISKYQQGEYIMNTVLKSGRTTAEIQSLGAELVSLKKDGCEYIWNGDKTYWAGHAPVLFPICCAVNIFILAAANSIARGMPSNW